MRPSAAKAVTDIQELNDKGARRMRRLVIALLLVIMTAAYCPAAKKRKSKRVKSSETTIVDEARQRKYDYFFVESVVQRENGNVSACFDLLRHCLNLCPDAPEANFHIAKYYRAFGDKEKSFAHFKKAAEADPDNTTYLEILGVSCMGTEHEEEGMAALERLVNISPNRFDILSVLQYKYNEKKEYDKALSVLDRMEKIEGKTEKISIEKSNIRLTMGDKQGAMEEMKSLADQYPNDPVYQSLYADVLLYCGENQQAYDLLTSLLKKEPGNTAAQLSLMSYYKAENQLDKADSTALCILKNENTNKDTKLMLIKQFIADNDQEGGDSTKVMAIFKEVLQQKQNDGEMAYLYATYLQYKEMPQEQIKEAFRRVIEIVPDHESARHQLVQMAVLEKNHEDVISLCQAGRQYHPDDIVFYYCQGISYYQLMDNAKALDTFRKGVSMANEQSSVSIISDMYAIMGDILYADKKPAEAFAAYDSCLQWKDDNTSCLNNYAYYLSLEGKNLDKAEQMSYKTIKAEPTNSTYLDTYAWILYMQKRYAEAKVYIEQAMSCDSLLSVDILDHAGDIMYHNQLIDDAVKLWKQALEKDPNNKVITRKIKLKKIIKQ